MFGSGRELYIGIDQRNYVPKLREQLGYIQYFREHQAENTEKIKAFLAAHDTPYCDAALEIVPYDGSKDLCVYAVVILTHESGLKIRYRTTNMHYFLVGGDNGWYTFEECMAHLLDAIGNNVNQLAFQANARGEATQEEIHEAARLVREAVQLVRDTL